MKERIGTIDGHAIYVDSGEDYVKILQEAIKKRIDPKKVKAGQTFMIPFDFDGQLVAEVHIKTWNDK